MADRTNEVVAPKAAPWRVDGPYVSFQIVRDWNGDGGYAGGGITIRCGRMDTVALLTWTERDKAEAVATARLIAAAPALRDALVKIIEMNEQYAIDRYGDASKAESMSCVRVAREALTALKEVKP